ncbi:MAG: Smr/MutS family protein [Candidatus Coatesbacteria bacterium]|nr:Smr/MutS family protein [Candidatus Coatesbacteria bacterium]
MNESCPLESAEYNSLELDKIIKNVSRFSRLNQLFDYKWQNDIISIRKEYKKIDEVYRLYSEGMKVSIYHIDLDINEFKKSLIVKTSLILELKKFFLIVNETYDFYSKNKNRAPLVFDFVACLVRMPELEKHINKTIDENGEIKDDASSELRNIRLEKKSIFGKIHSLIQKEIKSNKYLSDAQPTIRENRYVLPVDCHYASQYQGLFHGKSGTGQTFYIEPISLLPLNNRWRQIQEEEEEEMKRIILILCDEIRAVLKEIEYNFDIIKELDYLQSVSTYMSEYKAIIPSISENGNICLADMKHPLLIGSSSEVIPLNISWKRENPVLIISGPNAGGKTVVLKNIGIAAVMLKAALPVISNAGTEIPFFEKIYVDMGDKQSIENQISTYSAHINYIKRIINEANEFSLVLLDELGTSTDPDEGASIGAALLIELRNKHITTAVTTHLNFLKSLPLQEEGFIAASMSFSEENLMPLYKLREGIPGKSYGFEIAERIGIPSWLMKKAREFLDISKLIWINLINKLSFEVEEAQKERLEAKWQVSQAKAMNEESSKRLKNIDKEIRQIKDDAKKQAQDLIYGAKRLIEEEVARIKQSTASKETIKETREKLLKYLPKDEKNGKKYKDNVKISVGQTVYITNLKQTGIIEKIFPDNKVNVRLGSCYSKVNIDEIEIVDNLKSKEKSFSFKEEDKEPKLEIDIRGMYRDEIVSILDKFIDEAIRNQLKVVRIIHGKGTGALREEVHLYLSGNPNVKKYYSSERREGGIGATKVELNI